MVFFIKETLSAEDRAAWRKLAVHWDKAIRKKRRAAVRDWVEWKITGLSSLVFGGLIAFAVVKGSMRVLWIFYSLFLVIGGICILAAKPPRIERAASLSKENFPPPEATDTPVRAVFFEDGCFIFWASSKKNRLGYQAITAAWEDEGRFYLFIQDRPPLVLPKRGLGRWMPEDFRDFLERKLEEPVRRVE